MWFMNHKLATSAHGHLPFPGGASVSQALRGRALRVPQTPISSTSAQIHRKGMAGARASQADNCLLLWPVSKMRDSGKRHCPFLPANPRHEDPLCPGWNATMLRFFKQLTHQIRGSHQGPLLSSIPPLAPDPVPLTLTARNPNLASWRGDDGKRVPVR